jgi:hypothetical protein
MPVRHRVAVAHPSFAYNVWLSHVAQRAQATLT